MANRYRKFGVELEISRPVNCYTVTQALEALRLSHPVRNMARYCRSPGNHWDVKLDGTCGVEVASPRLCLNDFSELEQVCAALRDIGATQSTNCGTHVHHSARDLSTASLRKLLMWWNAMSPVFELIVPHHRRNNYHCSRITMPWEVVRTYTRVRHIGRYTSLNFTSLRRFGTVEFRTLEGTMDSERIYNWIVLTQSFVELSKRRTRFKTLEDLTQAPVKDRLQRYLEINAKYGASEDLYKAGIVALRTVQSEL